LPSSHYRIFGTAPSSSPHDDRIEGVCNLLNIEWFETDCDANERLILLFVDLRPRIDTTSTNEVERSNSKRKLGEGYGKRVKEKMKKKTKRRGSEGRR